MRAGQRRNVCGWEAESRRVTMDAEVKYESLSLVAPTVFSRRGADLMSEGCGLALADGVGYG